MWHSKVPERLKVGMPKEGIYVPRVANIHEHTQGQCPTSAHALRSNGSDVFHVQFSCLSKTWEQRSELLMIHQENFTYSTFGCFLWGTQPSSTWGQIQQRPKTDRIHKNKMMNWGPDPAWPLKVIRAGSPGTFNAYKDKLTGGRALCSIIYYSEADKKMTFWNTITAI